MKKNERYLKELQEKIKKRSNDINNLRIQNESAKKQLINMLKVNSRADFTEKAEHFLELLLHTEQAIDVLRHDFSEFTLSKNWTDLEKNFEPCIHKLQSIEKDILKTANIVEAVQTAILNPTTDV